MRRPGRRSGCAARGQDAHPILIREVALDLRLAPSLTQLRSNGFSPLFAGDGRADIERHVLADRTVQILGDRINFIVARGGGLGDYAQARLREERRNREEETGGPHPEDPPSIGVPHGDTPPGATRPRS